MLVSVHGGRDVPTLTRRTVQLHLRQRRQRRADVSPALEAGPREARPAGAGVGDVDIGVLLVRGCLHLTRNSRTL